MTLLRGETINRLAIYFFYDADGIVDRYVSFMLQEVKKNCCDLLIVCNGKLSPEGRDIFSAFTPYILVCEDIVSDFLAYKEAMEQYGWSKLANYDEVVMINHTVMGPIFPFAKMFQLMGERDLDFWGITKRHKTLDNSSEKCQYIPEHVQSYFIAVRKEMLQSHRFRQFWETIQKESACSEAHCCQEAVFTKAFADTGYKWDVFINTDHLEGFTDNPIIMDPVRLIRDCGCPVFLKNSFLQNYHAYLNCSVGTQAKELMRFLKEETDYDTGMVWEHILRTGSMATIKECLNLDFIIPKDYARTEVSQKKTALVIHSFFEDLVDYCYQYALSMPESSDIYITTGTEMLKKRVEARFLGGPWNNVTVILIENRGRDVSALMVGAAQYIRDYDYVCFVHDKKVSQLDTGIKGYSFSERCFQNLLGTKELVINILALFESEPYLGMLCPPPPNHAEYYPLLGDEWGLNFAATQRLANELKLSCPISSDHEPVAPLGTMFWFRPKALRQLLEHGWKYTDFPEEPIHTDGTLLHAMERIYPFVVQNSGYYCGWVLNDDYARTEWNNLSFMLRSMNIHAMRVYGGGKHSDLIFTMECWHDQNNGAAVCVPSSTLRRMIKQKLRARIPQPVWEIIKKMYHLVGGKKWLD